MIHDAVHGCMTKNLAAPLLLAIMGFHVHTHAEDAARAAPLHPVQAFLQHEHRIDFYEYQMIVSFPGSGVEDRHSFVRGSWLDHTMYWTWKSNSEDFTPSWLTGRFGEIRWETTAARHTTLYDATINSDPESQPVFRAGDYTTDAQWLTRLGMPEVDFSTATWSGADFEALAALGPGPHDRTPVTGQVASISDALYRITLTHAETAQALMHIDVQRDKNRASTFIPEHIERRDPLADGQMTRGVITVKSFALEGAKQPADYDPLTMSEIQPRAGLAFYSNDVLYAFAPGSTTEVNRVPTPDEVNAYFAKIYRKPTWRRAFQVLMLAALILAPIAVWRQRQQRNPERKAMR
jgi:hypothetical protein